ncbi:hypothetical protein OSTOST_14189, partial [Ostertagia ostertagi]
MVSSKSDIATVIGTKRQVPAQIIGHLGKDCIVNTVNGKNVINFTVAHTEKYKDSQGNQQERTTWVEFAPGYAYGYGWEFTRTGIAPNDTIETMEHSGAIRAFRA